MNKINQRIKLSIIFALVLVTFFLVDWFTKNHWFNENEVGLDIKHDHTLIGIRSVAHYNTTLLSSMNASIPVWAHHTINFSLIAVFTVFVFFTKKKTTAVALGILVAGMMGNAMDKLFTEDAKGVTFVRDIFYVPWLKNGNLGTFNAADAFVVAGAGLLAISTLITLFNENKAEKKIKLEKEQLIKEEEAKELPEKEEVIQQIQEEQKKQNKAEDTK